MARIREGLPLEKRGDKGEREEKQAEAIVGAAIASRGPSSLLLLLPRLLLLHQMELWSIFVMGCSISLSCYLFYYPRQYLSVRYGRI